MEKIKRSELGQSWSELQRLAVLCHFIKAPVIQKGGQRNYQATRKRITIIDYAITIHLIISYNRSKLSAFANIPKNHEEEIRGNSN